MFRVGIVGYGNLGRALEMSVCNFPDLELSAVFSRRDSFKNGYAPQRFVPYRNILEYKDKADALVLALGSATDLCENSEFLASHFNTVDSFDLHHNITKHTKNAEKAAKIGNKLTVVSSGWDPGIMSLARLYFSAFMPYAAVNSFWGAGVSQGHSEALRSIRGVRHAVQYTVPKALARQKALRGEKIKPTEAHKRICYVVSEPGAERRIEQNIKEMRGYFFGYDVEVNFISESDFFENHSERSHKGEVIASGICAGRTQTASLSLSLESNPLFTANILLATARAACRLNAEGACGALNLFDIPPKYFFLGDPSELL